MSLHEFLREGQDAPQRILSRLTQLLYNLSATVLQGVPFSPFTSFSRKSSWRDWNGERMKTCVFLMWRVREEGIVLLKLFFGTFIGIKNAIEMYECVLH